MSTAELVLGIILMVFSVAITVIVLMQKGHEENVGVVTGGADTFLSKTKRVQLMLFWQDGQKSLQLAFLCWLFLLTLICIFS